MRLDNKNFIWSFLAACIVFTGFQFVAWHKLTNGDDGPNGQNAPHHLQPPSAQTADEASSSRIIRRAPNNNNNNNTKKKNDPKSSGNTEEQVETQQRHHLVFSTSCHYTQDWQSYLFFYQAMKVNQPGDVTRIVSGCEPDQQKELQKIFDSLIGSMSDRFHIHFTPEFGKQLGQKHWEQTKYWNKPFSVRHWTEHVLGYPNSNEHDDDVVILLDPDMLLLRPFINDFTSFPEDLWTQSVRSQSGERIQKVSQGHIIAQQYGFGSVWLRAASKNLTHVVGPDSPVHKISMDEANKFHAGGPPYVMTARDMYRVTKQWSEFLPRLFDISPQFMAEMYGYCLAAAHLNIPQQLAYGMMISEVPNEQEGFYFLKDVPPEALCDADSRKSLPNVPHVLHFCHRYAIGEHFISKHVIPDLITSCNTPLVKLPPNDVAFTNYSHYGDNSVDIWEDKTRKLQYRNAYMICTLLPALHDASLYYKQKHCENPNLEESWSYFDWVKEEKEKKQAKV